MARALLTVESIHRAIHLLRGQRVMLDHDLARLYGVTTGRLNEAMKRNRARFPADFAFRLRAAEADDLKSQTAISSRHGGRRSLPMAFTEQGVAMLSGILNSRRAVAVNIEIMRAFVQMRKVLIAHAELAQRLAALEAEMAKHAAVFGHHKAETIQALKVVFETLKALASQAGPADAPRRPVGFDLR